MIEETEMEYKEKMLKLATMTDIPRLAQIALRIDAFYQEIQADPLSTVDKGLKTSSVLNLQKIVHGTSNDEKVRIRALRQALFTADQYMLDDMITKLGHASDTIYEVVKLSFLHKYMNDGGGYEWDTYKKMVSKIMLDLVSEAGRQHGAAQAKAAA